MLEWQDDWMWLAFGLLGNVLFFSRFFVQWIASERAGESVVPVAFWWLSIAGSLVLLVYAIHIGNPIFVLAYLPNAFIYGRNLVLVRNAEQRGGDAGG